MTYGLLANGIALKFQGYSDLKGKTLQEVLPPDIVKLYEPLYRSILEGEHSFKEHQQAFGLSFEISPNVNWPRRLFNIVRKGIGKWVRPFILAFQNESLDPFFYHEALYQSTKKYWIQTFSGLHPGLKQ